MGRARLLVFATIAAAVAACSLLVDTSGLENGEGPDGAALDGAGTDANGSGDGGGGPDGTSPPPPPGSDGGLDAADANDGQSSSYFAVVMSDTPVAYFRLGDAVGTTVAKNDSTLGSAPTGVLSAGVTLGTSGAIAFDPNTAATFTNGTGAKLDLGNFFAKFGDVAGTIEMWVKPLAAPANAPRFLVDRSTTTPTPRYMLFLFNDKVEFERYDADGGVDGVYSPTGTIAVGTWYHIAVTANTTAGMHLYVNGTQVDSSALAITLGDVGGNFYVGAKFSNPLQNGADAVIDEVAVYNKLLAAARITAHYQAGLGK